MNARIVELVQIADPTIDKVLDEFLGEQRRRLKPRTASLYEEVLHLLQRHLNSYAYESLSKPESVLFNRHYDAEGEDHREFCDIFGPDKIVENLGMFLGYFMIRKVVAGQELMRAAGTVTKKLSKWLASKGCISEAEAGEGAENGAEAARDLPNAERAARILCDATWDAEIDPEEIAEEDYLDFDHYTIEKVEPGRIWFQVWDGGRRKTCGPVAVPASATKLLRAGWDISCALVRDGNRWRMVEAANVYPG